MKFCILASLAFLSSTLLATPAEALKVHDAADEESGPVEFPSKAKEVIEDFESEVDKMMELHHGGEWRNKGNKVPDGISRKLTGGHSTKKGRRALYSKKASGRISLRDAVTPEQAAGCDCAKEAHLELQKTKDMIMLNFAFTADTLYRDDNDSSSSFDGDDAYDQLEQDLDRILDCSLHYFSMIHCGGCVDNSIDDGGIATLPSSSGSSSSSSGGTSSAMRSKKERKEALLSIKTYDCCCDVQTVKDIFKDQMIMAVGILPLCEDMQSRFLRLQKSVISSAQLALDGIVGPTTPYSIYHCEAFYGVPTTKGSSKSKKGSGQGSSQGNGQGSGQGSSQGNGQGSGQGGAEVAPGAFSTLDFVPSFVPTSSPTENSSEDGA